MTATERRLSEEKRKLIEESNARKEQDLKTACRDLLVATIRKTFPNARIVRIYDVENDEKLHNTAAEVVLGNNLYYCDIGFDRRDGFGTIYVVMLSTDAPTIRFWADPYTLKSSYRLEGAAYEDFIEDLRYHNLILKDNERPFGSLRHIATEYKNRRNASDRRSRR